jgi:hypothetical protein
LSNIFRNDTIDSKILNKYGIFVNRENPELIYFKPKSNTDESEDQDESARSASGKLYNWLKFKIKKTLHNQ